MTEPLLDRWKRKALDNPVLALVLAIAAVLGVAWAIVSAIEGLTGTAQRLSASRNKDSREYRRLAGLRAGTPVQKLTDTLGVPDLNRRSLHGLRERVWVRRLGNRPVALVLSRSDRRGTVELLAFIALDRDFGPTFTTPKALGGKQITLNQTRLAVALPDVPLVAASEGGAHGGAYYFEGLEPIGAGGFRSIIVGVSGLGAAQVPFWLPHSFPANGASSSDFNERLQYPVLERWIRRHNVKKYRQATAIDTYGFTETGVAPGDVGAPWLLAEELQGIL